MAGKAPIKRNRFVKLAGGSKSINRALEAKTRALAGLKAHITNVDNPNPNPEFVIGAYHQLWRIEKSFRMSKHDLRARPIYHHKRESIEAHLSIVFAALAITQLIEDRTGWSVKKYHPHSPPLPHRPDPHRQADRHRRRPTPTRPTRRPRPHQLRRGCTLI